MRDAGRQRLGSCHAARHSTSTKLLCVCVCVFVLVSVSEPASSPGTAFTALQVEAKGVAISMNCPIKDARQGITAEVFPAWAVPLALGCLVLVGPTQTRLLPASY